MTALGAAAAVLAIAGMVALWGAFGALARLADLASALLEIERERHGSELRDRAESERLRGVLARSQAEIAEAQTAYMKTALAAAADQQRYRDEQREHMRVCAERYALVAGGAVDGEVKH